MMNDFVLSLLLAGALSTGGQLPFWMTTNQYGLMPEHNGAIALLGAHTQYDTSKDFQWRWGVSLAANYDNGPLLPDGKAGFSLMADEIYASIRWKYFSLDAGMKHDPVDFYASSPLLGSLSTTGGHVISSGNARTMPGYMINIESLPIPFTKKHVWLDAGFGDFTTLDNRWVQGALVHRNKLSIKVNITRRLDFTLGLDHYAVWGGTSPQYGRMPITFGNYFRVVMGLRASTAGTANDQMYAIGNHGGGEIWRFDYRGNGWKATFLHDVPYEDLSGILLQNFPDGVNTLCFGFDNKDRWISDIVYEFIYTRNQSGWYYHRPGVPAEHAEDSPIDDTYPPRSGGDNYFNNGEYRSGWTHFGRTIGLPLISPEGTHSGTWTSRRLLLGIENNRIRAHHIGLSGKLFRKSPYKFLFTYSQNYGTYRAPYCGESPWEKLPGTVKEIPLHQFSTAFTGEVPLRHISLTYGLYGDWGELLPSQFGALLGLRYVLR